MATQDSILPMRSPVETEADPQTVGLDDGGALIEVLSSETARGITARLHEKPMTASELADAVDTSVQNATYHLDNLQAAGVVDVVETWYSEKGSEMKVYAPTNDPLVIVIGADGDEGAVQGAVDEIRPDTGLHGNEPAIRTDGGTESE